MTSWVWKATLQLLQSILEGIYLDAPMLKYDLVTSILTDKPWTLSQEEPDHTVSLSLLTAFTLCFLGNKHCPLKPTTMAMTEASFRRTLWSVYSHRLKPSSVLAEVVVTTLLYIFYSGKLSTKILKGSRTIWSFHSRRWVTWSKSLSLQGRA